MTDSLAKKDNIQPFMYITNMPQYTNIYFDETKKYSTNLFSKSSTDYVSANSFIKNFVNKLPIETNVSSSDVFDNILIANNTSAFNKRNNEIEENIQLEFKKKLTDLLENEEIEIGKYSEADKLINFYLKNHNALSHIVLNTIFTLNFRKDFLHVGKLCKFLLLISRADKSKLSATGKVIAIGALTHQNDEVKEYGIRIFENYSDKESLDMLEASEKDADWIQEYKEEVIEYIRSKIA